MSVNRIQTIAVRTIEKQSISVEDLQDLQSILTGEDYVSRAEAESLLRMECLVPERGPFWAGFFIATLTAHLVWEQRPTGRVVAEDVAWLEAALAGPRSGNAENLGAMLMTVVREADHVDSGLLVIAMRENRGSPRPATAEAEVALAA